MKPTPGRVVFYYPRGYLNEKPFVAFIVFVQGAAKQSPNASEQDEANYVVNLAVLNHGYSSDRNVDLVDYADSVVFHPHPEGEAIGYGHWSWPPRV